MMRGRACVIGAAAVLAGGVAASWERKQVALETALRKAAHRKAAAQPSCSANAIPFEFLIPGIAWQLILMVPNPGIRRRQPVSAEKATRERHDLAGKIDKCLNSLDGLSPTAIGALNYRREALRDVQLKLRILKACAETSEPASAEPASAEPASAEPASAAKGGRPRKVSAKNIAEVVGQHFRGLTGKRPTVSVYPPVGVKEKDGKAYGPFLDLMTDVFTALEIKASPEVWARHVVVQARVAKGKTPTGKCA